MIDSKSNVAYAVGDEPSVQQEAVKLKYNNVKQDVAKQTSDFFVKMQQELTNDVITFKE